MGEFAYRTRGVSSPQGKARVYFCCHPMDFGTCFEPISDDILAQHNCAVWYDPAVEKEYDTSFFEALRLMQLFVMPVTSRLLSGEREVLTREFRFAVENHIPVLPIMMEPGLDRRFNETCGDLQFLSCRGMEKKRGEYEEKLQGYLAAVLLGDALTERIRAAFDAYIFLSYRKKDRKAARKLMEIIHKNERFRDIAIWYDEFLTPGENFNEAIRDAIEKSSLFVLSVTPNLVSEPNYITRKEYPLAKEAGKPILPAELVSTDYGKLAEAFSDLPICVDAYDEEALYEALEQYIKQSDAGEQQPSAEQTFYIGLAYLYGVDMEVDREKALSLISFAAEAGIEDAMGQLVGMYEYGLGVPRSYEAAIEWRRKLIGRREAEYHVQPTYDRLMRLAGTCYDCGSSCLTIGNLAEAKTYHQKALELLRNDSQPETLRALYFVTAALGEICQAEGDLQNAETYFAQTLQLNLQLSQEGLELRYLQDLPASYDRLGLVSGQLGNLDKAEECFTQALTAANLLVYMENDSHALGDVMRGYVRLAGIYKARGELQRAEEYYENGLAIAIRQAEETRMPQELRDLAHVYVNLGDIYFLQGDLEQSKVYYGKGISAAEALTEQLGQVGDRIHLINYHCLLGNAYWTQQSLNEAKECFQKALAVGASVPKEAQLPALRRELAVAYSALGNVLGAEGAAEDAVRMYEAAFTLRAELEQETNTLASKRDLAASCEDLGGVFFKAGNLQEAKSYYELAGGIRQTVHRGAGTVESAYELAVSYERLGSVYLSGGNPMAAEACCMTAYEICSDLLRHTQAAGIKRFTAALCQKLALIFGGTGRPQQAETYFRQALALSSEQNGTTD